MRHFLFFVRLLIYFGRRIEGLREHPACECLLWTMTISVTPITVAAGATMCVACGIDKELVTSGGAWCVASWCGVAGKECLE